MKLDFSKARIAIVGDAMVDVWHWGHWSKITGEGIPAFAIERTEERSGGAANVAEQVTALGAKAHLFSKPRRLWPRKIRFSAHGTVFRADREDCIPITEDLQQSILADLEALRPDIIVLSDYAKGMLGSDFCQAIIALGIPVVIDPKGDDWHKYTGAHVITPNAAEWRSRLSAACPDSNYLVTLGEQGMNLIARGCSGPVYMPSIAHETRDVTGAGDTVIATLAACLAIGIDLPEAARIANVAAGISVGKWGTAFCTLEELEAAL